MNMPKRQLGAGGPMVGAIGLGAMSFGGIFGATDEDTSRACLDAALNAGIDFWDTANVYGPHVSEEVLGRYLADTGAAVTLATKGGIIHGPERIFRNDEDHIRAELEGSLKRLGRDKVELYYMHRREAARPVEEVVEMLARLIEEGLIDGYGLSEIAPATLRRAHAVHPCRAVQNEYSLWSRQPELGLIDLCAELGIAFVPFSPLARGMLGSDYPDPSAMGKADFRRQNPRFMEPNFSANKALIDPFKDWAASRGWTASAAALAWVLDKGDHLLPIPGTRTAAHLKEWAAAWEISLTEADKAEVARLLPAGFAHGDRYSDAQIVGIERYC